MTDRIALAPYLAELDRMPAFRWTGQVTEVIGLLIESRGPNVAIGDFCEVRASNGRRIRMQVIPDASGGSLCSFIESSVEPGSTIHTDGWQAYASIVKKGYTHEVSPIRARPREASKLLPHVHRVASLLKRWLLGTHQGAVEPQHLPYYLDEFTFRFNRRTSQSRGKLFYRLMQQAVATEPITYAALVQPPQRSPAKPQEVGAT